MENLSFLETVFGGVFIDFWVQNGGQITKNLSKMRSENETGDFSKIVLSCTQEHDF